MKVFVQKKENGAHRIVASHQGRYFPGDWSQYQSPSFKEHEGRKFVHFTDYWTRFAPVETAMELKEVPDEEKT